MKIVITGAEGFLGQRVTTILQTQGHHIIALDVDQDILTQPIPEADACIHLAANKYATQGEQHPTHTAHLNITGTARVTNTIPRTILASTCKAAAPTTAYGASKLIAERITLNAGGTVIRLVNVLHSTGSVTDIWRQLPPTAPLPVTNCRRMFITANHAAHLLANAIHLPPGRYAPTHVQWLTPTQLANTIYPGRPTTPIPLRNGDRPTEQLTNPDETTEPQDNGYTRIRDAWEPQRLEAAA